MWTNVNQVYTTYHSQNAWAHLAGTNAWHKILTGAADGVTNVHLILTAAKANNRQVYVVLDANKNITAVYM
jgi:uncharacterized protein YbjT (DUF2867 family)